MATCGVMLTVACGIAAAQRQVAQAATPPGSQIALANQDEGAADEKATPQKATDPKQAAAKQQPEANAAASANDLAKNALDKITQLSSTRVDAKALNEAAIRGMLQSLNDPYSSMMTAEQVAKITVDAMVRGKRNVIPGLMNKLSCWGDRKSVV